MNANSRKSMGWAAILIAMGIAAFLGGTRWLLPLIPAAVLVWYAAGPSLRTGRN